MRPHNSESGENMVSLDKKGIRIKPKFSQTTPSTRKTSAQPERLIRLFEANQL